MCESEQMTNAGSASEPVHLNNHHTDTVSAILSHPTGHNIRWVDAISLVEAIGNVEEKHDGKFRITIGHEIEVFHRPRHKDLETQQVLDLRRMLSNAGYVGKDAGKEV